MVVTSRRGRFDRSLGVAGLALDMLPRPESVALLRQYVSKLAQADAEAIAAELGDFPLALSLAGSFLERYRSVSPAAYLAQLKDKELLEHPSLQGRGSSHSPTAHELSVGRTFALSYDRLDPADETDRLALALLARAACFAPGVPIPRDLLLATLAPEEEEDETPAVDPLAAEDGLTRLVELGLVEEETDGAVRLHRLVAAFTRQAAGERMEAAAGAVAKAVAQAARAINQSGFPRRLLAWQEHLRYVADAAAELEDEQAAWLSNELGYHLLQMGDYAGARPYYERALAIWEQALGPDHPLTARSLNSLGTLLQAQGDTAGARPYCERALAIREKVLGPEHPDTARSLDNLGHLLQAQGDYAGARPYVERALAIREKAMGPDHPTTAISLNNLGGLLQAQGDYAGARPYLERALAIREKVLGPDHPNTQIVRENLAGLAAADKS